MLLLNGTKVIQIGLFKIWSEDSSRIGSLHNGALDDLKFKSVIEFFLDDHKIKSFKNSPVFFREKVIGIIGNPNDVRQFT